jgi:hypothetical protein
MKLVKATAIVFFLATGATMVVFSVGAQQPPTAGTTPSIGIPENAPPSWRQQDWNAMRARCLQLSAKVKERQQMTQEQLKSVGPLTSYDLRDAETCLSKIAQPPAPPPSTSFPGQPVPTPVTLIPADLMNLTVDITIVAGRVVYERGRPATASSDTADLRST